MNENTKANIQDTPSEIKESCVAARNVKIYMKLEDPETTYDLFHESIGKENTVIESCNANFEKDRQMQEEIGSKFKLAQPNSITSNNSKVYSSMIINKLQSLFKNKK